MASLQSKLEEQLSCAICLEQLNNPKALPCLHSFCHDCLVKIIKNGKLVCPKCRICLEISDPPDISFLPCNFLVNSILESLSDEELSNAKEKNVCQNCDTQCPAKYRCVNCGLSLCRLCAESHMLSSENIRDHAILPLDEKDGTIAATTASAEDVVNLGCLKHNRSLGAFCVSCQTAVCEICVSERHEEHEFLPIGDVVDKERDEISDLLDKVKNEKTKLSEHLSLVKSNEEALVARKETVISNIISYFENLTQLIARRKEELVEQATQVFQSRQKDFFQPEECLETAVTSCHNVITTAEEILHRGNDAEILNQKSTIVKCLKSLPSTDILEEKISRSEDGLDFVTEYSVKEVDEKIFQCCYVLKEVVAPKFCTASLKVPKAVVQVEKMCAVTVFCKDKSNKCVKNGGQLITPIFTGVKVKDVSVCDNNNGSYDVKFMAQEVGTLNFQVLINGHSAQNCCLSKKVTWVLRENIGNGILSDNGLTLTGDRSFGNWCYRVGNCSFQTGVYSWKIEIKFSGNHSIFSSKKEVDVGVINSEGDLSYESIKTGRTQKWSATSSAEVIAVLKLDMVQHSFSVQFTGGVNLSNNSVAPTQYTFDITADKVCPYLAVHGKHLSLTIKQL